MKNNNIGLVSESVNTNGAVIITNGFINALAVNRTQTKALTSKMFSTIEHFRRWKKVVGDFQAIAYDIAIDIDAGVASSESKMYQLNLTFDVIMNYFKKENLQAFGDVATLKNTLVLSSRVRRKDNGDELSKLEGKIPMILGFDTYRKLLEDVLYDRISNKKHRSYEEQQTLKEERATRRKAKRAAEKAAKIAAAEAAEAAEAAAKADFIDVEFIEKILAPAEADFIDVEFTEVTTTIPKTV